jgi:hypothetical protein
MPPAVALDTVFGAGGDPRSGDTVAMVEMLPGVPPEAERLFAELLKEGAVPEATLRSELDAHVGEIRAAAANNEFLDVSLAFRLAEVCSALLEEGERQGSEEAWRLVQAATRYFILDDDGEHDLDSVCGLDDDAEVCNAVSEHLGRPDLLIEL